jgi:hypothetical protein
MQTNIQGTEISHHSFSIHFGSDELFKKTPAVCRAKLKYSHLQYTKEDGYPHPIMQDRLI